MHRLTSINRSTPNWIRTDGGGESIENKFQKWLSQRGIVHEITTEYLPESNGSAERLNKTLEDMERIMPLGLGAQCKNLWAEVVYTSAFLRNRLFSKSSRENRTPYEIIHRKKSGLAYVRIFGSQPYVHKNKNRDGKLDESAQQGIVVGYYRANEYGVIMDDENKIVDSQNVRDKEDAAYQLPDYADVVVIEFDLSDEGAIFDDFLSSVDPESVMEVSETYRKENESSTNMDLYDTIYHPRLRRSEL